MDRQLRVEVQGQHLLRPAETKVEEIEAQGFTGVLEDFTGLRVGAQPLDHAYRLRTLAGKEEGHLRHGALPAAPSARA